MRYYNIQLSENASNLCKIILPCVKQCYNCLLMGVINSPDTFQQKMENFQMVWFYTCIHRQPFFILTGDDWKYHVQRLGLTLNKPMKLWCSRIHPNWLNPTTK